jgi:c-di-GMP-binding flagellar brake protein YcgR
MVNRTIPLQAEVLKNVCTGRRAWIRMPKEQQVSCQATAALGTEESETEWTGTVRDISAGGIAVVLNRRFEPGTLLIVDLPGHSKSASRPRPVRVVHATPEREGQWLIGCAFASPLSQNEILNILQQ